MKSSPKALENSWLWLLKISSGVLVIVLIMVHLVINHLVVQGGLMTYIDVVNYLSHPWIAFMESSFLIVVIAHGLLGTRSIILDLNPPLKWQKFIDGMLIFVGFFAAVYGIWLIRLIVIRGA
jgi:succinate dehydrogenase / fumarate reductase, membrane anchor subunit